MNSYRGFKLFNPEPGEQSYLARMVQPDGSIIDLETRGEPWNEPDIINMIDGWHSDREHEARVTENAVEAGRLMSGVFAKMEAM